MSKYIFVKYRELQDSSERLNDLNKICDEISPSDLNMKHSVYENTSCQYSYVGVQNALTEQSNTGCLLIGHVNGEFVKYNKVKDPLPDGSYSLIRFNNDKVEFFCDEFCSRSLWYVFDEEKIIISNSQRALISLKKVFKLNKKTIAWFLSSGSQGPFLSWDQDISMVTPGSILTLSIVDWEITKSDASYCYEGMMRGGKEKEFDKLYIEHVQKSLKKIIQNFRIDEVVIPLSGGYDSRLLLSLSSNEKKNIQTQTINWGIDNNYLFDDKNAAREISQYYKTKHIDILLPKTVNDFSKFLQNYIQAGDCRIDHINAYTDNFELWKDLFLSGIKILIRGDIPYPTVTPWNNKTARTNIGINRFVDYANCKDYRFEGLLGLQEDTNYINRGKKESSTQWRDRLYIKYRIPIVVSAFSDIINSYIENRSPMMSGNLFYNYSRLKDSTKGNKRHIVRICKSLDKSNVRFDATPSLISSVDIFNNANGVHFLKNYLLSSCDYDIIKKELINDVVKKLEQMKFNGMDNKTLMKRFRVFLSNKLPNYLKVYLKSKIRLELNPLILAFRIVMVDIAIKMYNKDSTLIK